jgi:hypothetical protein
VNFEPQDQAFMDCDIPVFACHELLPSLFSMHLAFGQVIQTGYLNGTG